MNTEWRDVVGFPDYEVSNFGGVRNKKTGRVLRPSNHNKYGHKFVTLCNNGSRDNMKVHRLVLTAFVGECPQGLECRHLDGDPANNHIENLAWGTRSENALDAFKHGTRVNYRGEACRASKLTTEDILEIRRIGKTMSQRGIAKQFGVSQVNIGLILNRKNWAHI